MQQLVNRGLMARIIAASEQNHRGCNLKAVNPSSRRIADPAPLFIIFLLCGLTLNNSLAATSLFDPERGALAQDSNQPANSGSLRELRLDGILMLGDLRRVVISGPEGETYRFVWRGVIEKPIASVGDPGNPPDSYRLASAEARSVWLQLPSGVGCQPDPGIGIVACEEGRAKLAMVPRSFPPAVENTSGNNTQQQGAAPDLTRRLQQRQNAPPTTPLTASQSATGSSRQGITPASTRRLPPQRGTQLTEVGARNRSAGVQSESQSQNVVEKNSIPEYEESAARKQLREEQQRLIDSAPPGYFGIVQ